MYKIRMSKYSDEAIVQMKAKKIKLNVVFYKSTLVEPSTVSMCPNRQFVYTNSLNVEERAKHSFVLNLVLFCVLLCIKYVYTNYENNFFQVPC